MKIHLAFTACAALTLAACQEAPTDSATDMSASDAAISPPGDSPVPTQAPSPSYDGPIPMPIRVGLNGPDSDSCPSYGEVFNLDAGSETYLSVRDAPSAEVKERDRLEAGHGIHICGEEGDWFGIVYDKDDEANDCNADGPVETPRNYSGPCAHGWVEAKYVNRIAG